MAIKTFRFFSFDQKFFVSLKTWQLQCTSGLSKLKDISRGLKPLLQHSAVHSNDQFVPNTHEASVLREEGN